jgi:organic radical activating enzyme
VEKLTSLQHLRYVEWVTISGGEPALQIDQDLIDAISDYYHVAVETNGTKQLQAEVDYLTVSPKLPMSQTVVRKCDSLKLLWPHPDPLIYPSAYNDIEAKERYLQPIETGDPVKDARNIQSAIDCLYTMPGWKLSLQTHKMIGVE